MTFDHMGANAPERNIVPFLFEQEHAIRSIIGDDNEPWFVAKDICKVLEIKNVPQAVGRLDPDEVAAICFSDSSSQAREVNIVSEPGAYRLVMRSNKPIARRFIRWLTHEVLPSIRKTGGYAFSGAGAAPDEVGQSDAMKLRKVAEARMSFGARAGAQMWYMLGLPVVPAMTDQFRQTDMFSPGECAPGEEGEEAGQWVFIPAGRKPS